MIGAMKFRAYEEIEILFLLIYFIRKQEVSITRDFAFSRKGTGNINFSWGITSNIKKTLKFITTVTKYNYLRIRPGNGVIL